MSVNLYMTLFVNGRHDFVVGNALVSKILNIIQYMTLSWVQCRIMCNRKKK